MFTNLIPSFNVTCDDMNVSALGEMGEKFYISRDQKLKV